MIIEDQRSDRVRRIPGLAGARERPRVSTLKCVKPSKSDPYACFVLSRASSNIRSIERHHEMSDELSTSSEYDGVASQTLLPGARENIHPAALRGCESVEIGPIHGLRVTPCGF